MKIVLTGSLGHIGKPLTEGLVKKGHAVTVVSSKAEKTKEIEALGALAAIGSVEDVAFLTNTFTGADAVYCMVPPTFHFNDNLDLVEYFAKLAAGYVQAIEKSGVKHVVHLSSVGAHLDKKSGIILGHHAVESALSKLHSVPVTTMRPVGFYYNTLSFIPMIKYTGAIASNYGGDDLLPWVAPVDIAEAVAEEISTPQSGRKIRYVASEELRCNEVARILGEAIGKPDLKWNVISDEQALKNLESAGLPKRTAEGLVEMNAAQHSGLLMEDYFRNRPAVMGKVKMTDFAKEFAAAFNAK